MEYILSADIMSTMESPSADNVVLNSITPTSHLNNDDTTTTRAATNNSANINNSPTALNDSDAVKTKSACARCCAPVALCCVRLCRPCLRTSHPMSDPPTRCQRCADAMLCPPHGKLARYVTLLVMGALVWATLWAIVGKDALPGGNFFGLVVLVAACLLGGKLVTIIRLPALLGE